MKSNQPLFVASIAATMLFGTIVVSAEQATGALTVADLATVLDLQIAKFTLEHTDNVADEKVLNYWVESFKPDGSKTIHDETTVGLGNGAGHVLIKFPAAMQGEYGVYGSVNASWGKSKLTVNVATDGAEAWHHTRDKSLPKEGEMIIAIRVAGLANAPSEKLKMADYLKLILAAKPRRVDVFKVSVRAVK